MATKKLVIVGLGNPGKDYERTHHNMGFLVLDYFAKKNDFPAFSEAKKTESLASEGKIENTKVILLKPQTFMNESGKAIAKTLKFYEVKPKNLIVVQDDTDIVFEKIKVSKNRNSAGHKGIESIIKAIKTKDFTRIRIGTGKEGRKRPKAMEVVLKKLSSKEETSLLPILKTANELILCEIKKEPE